MINEHSRSNIALARLRMDMMYTGGKHDPTEELPDPVHAMFEAVVASIRQQADGDLAKVGLWCISFVSERLESGRIYGDHVTWEEVRSFLGQRMLGNKVEYTIRTVLHAAQGVLLLENEKDLDVSFYNNTFRHFTLQRSGELRAQPG